MSELKILNIPGTLTALMKRKLSKIVLSLIIDYNGLHTRVKITNSKRFKTYNVVLYMLYCCILLGILQN